MIIDDYNINWRIGYLAFSLALVVLGWLTWWWVVKTIDHSQSRNGKKIC